MTALADDAGPAVVAGDVGEVGTPDDGVLPQGDTRDAAGAVVERPLHIVRADNRAAGSRAVHDFTVVHRAAHRTRVGALLNGVHLDVQVAHLTGEDAEETGHRLVIRNPEVRDGLAATHKRAAEAH